MITVLDDSTTIDRTYEFAEPDSEVSVVLSDGFKARFFQSGLTDLESIRRAKLIRDEEKED